MSDPDIHAFQGIVTKLRTTKGSPFALDVMAEAADLIEYKNKLVTLALAEMDRSTYGDPEVPFRMRAILELP